MTRCLLIGISLGSIANLRAATYAPHDLLAGSSGLGSDGRLRLGGLAHDVVALEIVGPDGELRHLRRGAAGWEAAVVSLGLLGVMTSITLRLVPSYQVRNRVYGTWPPVPTAGSLDALVASLPQLLETDSFSAFVDWSVDSSGLLLLRDIVTPGKQLVEPASHWCNAPLALQPITSFIEGSDLEATGTGPWHDRLSGLKPFAITEGRSTRGTQR